MIIGGYLCFYVEFNFDIGGSVFVLINFKFWCNNVEVVFIDMSFSVDGWYVF